jgi:protein-tyrosine phosphatase
MSLICYSSDENVGNKVFLGSKKDAKDKDKLQKLGITHILNCTPEKDVSVQAGVPNYFEKSGCFKYKRIPVFDAATTDFIQYAPSIVSFISTGLHYGSVLVHCQKGVSRSVTALVIWMMNKKGMSLETALSMIRAKRNADPDNKDKVPDPIPAFINQLKQYEARLAVGAEKKVMKNTHGKKRKVSEAPTLPTPKRTIGPSLPPENAKESTKIRTIGPSLPPPTISK